MKFLFSLLLFWQLFLLLLTSNAWANPFSEVHESISKRLVNLAGEVDGFFINVKDVEEQNKTSLRFYQTFAEVEHEDFDSKFNFRLNLNLPNLERRFKISFERQARAEETNLSGSGERLETESSEREEYTRGGLEYLIPRLFDFEIKLSC